MADEALDGMTPPVGELPASPSGPKDGSAPPAVDSDFIMSTLFGEDAPTPPSESKPEGDQGTGAKPEGGAEQGTAPPAPAPAAKGDEPAPPEKPPVPGVSSSQAAPPEQKPPVPAAQTPAPGTPPAAVPPQEPESRLTPEERLQLASMRGLQEQNAQLIEMLRNQQQQPQGQPAPGQPPQPSGGQTPPEQVHLTVPDELYNAVFAEDETMSKRGMNILVSSIATAAVNFALQKMGPMVDQRFQSYDQRMKATTTAQQQEADYYGAFEAHKNPVFRPVIESEMAKMAQEMPNAPWNEDFRNALGMRVNRTLQLLGFNVGMVPAPQAQPGGGQPPAAGFGAQPQGNGAPPPAPAPMLDNSSRQAAPQSGEDFIAATFA